MSHHLRKALHQSSVLLLIVIVMQLTMEGVGGCAQVEMEVWDVEGEQKKVKAQFFGGLPCSLTYCGLLVR